MVRRSSSTRTSTLLSPVRVRIRYGTSSPMRMSLRMRSALPGPLSICRAMPTMRSPGSMPARSAPEPGTTFFTTSRERSSISRTTPS